MKRRAVGLLALVVACAALALAAQDAAPDTAAGPDPVGVVGAPRKAPVSDDALEALTTAVASKLRCPVCQGLSVQDSPTSSARNMRNQIKEMLARGFDEEQVALYFESSYGEFVRLEPPLRGINWLVWLAPLGGLGLGGLALALAWRKLAGRAAGPAVSAVPDRDCLPDDPALAAALLRVREQVWGWPGGLSPGRRAAARDEA